jgi:hypothetical protein
MILIEENFDGVLMESAVDGKKTYLSGIFMESGNKNRNGRIYDSVEMQREVDKINAAAKAGRFVLGELDHPNSLEIKLENVSHKIVEMTMKGNLVYGKAEIIEKHPKGQILKALVDSGIQVGVSSRGSGQVNESTGTVRNFGLVTVDAVATPSCRSAYPETIQEQLEYYKRGGIVTDLSEAVIHDIAAQRYFQAEMKKFIETLYSK